MSGQRGRARGLQTCPFPLTGKNTENPDRHFEQSEYHRHAILASPGPTPSETYQYNYVYDLFCKDYTFRDNWHVVGHAPNYMGESITQERASIRVVMDLPSSQKLLPTAYTPGFATLPRDSIRDVDDEGSFHGTLAIPKPTPSLPEGYSVALEVHILEDVRIMLQHQRDFRKGHIDPKYEWLDKIIQDLDSASGTDRVNKGRPRAKQKQAKPEALALVQDRPEAKLRPAVGFLPDEPKEAGLTDWLKPYSQLYGEEAASGRSCRRGRLHVYAECQLVSAFGDDVELPPREYGTWAQKGEKSTKQLRQDRAEILKHEESLRDLLGEFPSLATNFLDGQVEPAA